MWSGEMLYTFYLLPTNRKFRKKFMVIEWKIQQKEVPSNNPLETR